MKKYKLIKEYPGSWTKDTIVEFNKNSDRCLINGVTSQIPAMQVIGYPEFWEEIIEKDYEILSFKVNSTLYEYSVVDKKYKSNILAYTLEEMIGYLIAPINPTIINSIKRLSDGEVFTIGDKCISGQASGVITKIWFCDNGELRIDSPGNYCVDIKTIQHYKKPLFITEDGVDIHIGDEYFELIVPGFHNEQCVWNILPYEGRCNLIYDQEGNRKHFRLWFSTKEKAQEYIDLYKPKYSLSDINTLLRTDKEIYITASTINVINSKLKQLNK